MVHWDLYCLHVLLDFLSGYYEEIVFTYLKNMKFARQFHSYVGFFWSS